MTELPREVSEALAPAFADSDEFSERTTGVWSDVDRRAIIEKHIAKRGPSTQFIYGRRAPRT